MYKHIAKTANEYLAKEQTLPKNTREEGNGTALRIGGGIGGSVELVMVAEGECSLPANATIGMEIIESDTIDGEYTKSAVSGTIGSTENMLWDKGDALLRLPISSYNKPYIKVAISSTSSSVDGIISVVPSHLPR